MPAIEVTGVETIQAVLSKLESKLGDMTPAFAAIGQELDSRVSARFETETDPNGRPWDDWAPSTERYYPKDGHAKKLDRSGTMQASRGFRAGRSSVEVGFAQPYAAYHEFGTKKMSRRGLLFADPDAGTLGRGDIDAIAEVLDAYLRGW